MRVHDSQAHRKMDVIKGHNCHILELREILGSGQVLWTCTGRNTSPAPYKNIPFMIKITGVNTASLDVYLHSSKTWARSAEGVYNELNGHVFDLERDRLRQVVLCP